MPLFEPTVNRRSRDRVVQPLKYYITIHWKWKGGISGSKHNLAGFFYQECRGGGTVDKLLEKFNQKGQRASYVYPLRARNSRRLKSLFELGDIIIVEQNIWTLPVTWASLFA